MRTVQFPAQRLRPLFRRQRIATMAELKETLGTASDATVFRKLKELSYLTSYSDRGRYYTLALIPRFDDLGLWCYRNIRFSQYGTLRSTAETWVCEAEAGWRADELEALLQVSVKETLLRLIYDERIAREKVEGRFLYSSADPRIRKRQVSARKARGIEADLGSLPARPRVEAEELKAAIVLFFSLLDEKERRLYAALESLKIGHGGDRKMAELLGLDVGTIARGRQQLLEQDVEIDRVRKVGAGRKSLEKKRRQDKCKRQQN